MAWLTELRSDGLVVDLNVVGIVRVGRSVDNEVVLDRDARVSRHHAELIHRQGTWWIRDLQSRNHTFVNGRPVEEVSLAEGDNIRVGSHELVFTEAADPLSTMADEPTPGQEGMIALSAREKEVLALVAAGATDVQIARALTIGLATVHSHLDRIRDKSGRRRRPDLTRLAAELGLPAARPPNG